MKNYVKLVNFEVNRFFKLYVILIALLIACQLIGVVIEAKGYLNRRIKEMPFNQGDMQIAGYSLGDFMQSAWFGLPIIFCAAMLMIYVFFIWYRDWFGKNTFIYRLLMLPTERITIYFAKLTAILFFVLGLVALQILLMLIEIQIVNSIIPADFRSDFSFYGTYYFEFWTFLYPNTLTEFVLMYGVGLVFVAVLFTAILLERSFRLKGIFFAIFYGLVSFGIFIVPFFLEGYFPYYFYPIERFLMMLATGLIVLGSAIWIANYLLKHKIRV